MFLPDVCNKLIVSINFVPIYTQGDASRLRGRLPAMPGKPVLMQRKRILMQVIRNFKEMADHLRSGGYRQRLVVVCAYDDSTRGAVARAVSEGFAEAIFVGDRARVEQHPEVAALGGHVRFVEAADGEEAARVAVGLVRGGKADILMKGLVNTDVLLRAVLDKEHGILPQGRVLTHVAVAQVPAYGRLIFLSDAAVIPNPTQEQRIAQVGYAANVCRSFGIAVPRISLIHCSEKASPKFPYTEGYAEIIRMAAQGEWGELVVDGPLDVRTSCDPHSCDAKGIRSSLEGRADVLLFPNIEAGNAFYKTLSLFAQADVAGVLQGTICPVVLPSRSDSVSSKYHSIAMAAVCNN